MTDGSEASLPGVSPIAGRFPEAQSPLSALRNPDVAQAPLDFLPWAGAQVTTFTGEQRFWPWDTSFSTGGPSIDGNFMDPDLVQSSIGSAGFDQQLYQPLFDLGQPAEAVPDSEGDLFFPYGFEPDVNSYRTDC